MPALLLHTLYLVQVGLQRGNLFLRAAEMEQHQSVVRADVAGFVQANPQLDDAAVFGQRLLYFHRLRNPLADGHRHYCPTTHALLPPVTVIPNEMRNLSGETPPIASLRRGDV